MFQISTIANFGTDVYEVLKLFDSSGDKHDEKISDCSSTPKLVQAHDSSTSLTFFNFSHDKTPNLMVLVKYHSEMKRFFFH